MNERECESECGCGTNITLVEKFKLNLPTCYKQ